MKWFLIRQLRAFANRLALPPVATRFGFDRLRPSTSLPRIRMSVVGLRPTTFTPTARSRIQAANSLWSDRERSCWLRQSMRRGGLASILHAFAEGSARCPNVQVRPIGPSTDARISALPHRQWPSNTRETMEGEYPDAEPGGVRRRDKRTPRSIRFHDTEWERSENFAALRDLSAAEFVRSVVLAAVQIEAPGTGAAGGLAPLVDQTLRYARILATAMRAGVLESVRGEDVDEPVPIGRAARFLDSLGFEH